jgi:two-component system response regulator LytT
MDIVIIEDEKPAARLLQRKIGALGYDVRTMLHSVEESLEWFAANKHPDLIFLDIQLSDGLSFEIFEKAKIDSAIIFTTAYDEYALRAFKLNSIDYLLKPIDEEELALAVRKFEGRNNTTSMSGLDISSIRNLFFNPVSKVYRKRFTIRLAHQLKVIHIEDVELLYSENRGTYVHTKDNRDYLLDCTLEQIEAELSPEEFFRISRKFIVPLKGIKEIVVYSNSRLKLLLPTYTADEVIVSRERVAEFKEWLG